MDEQVRRKGPIDRREIRSRKDEEDVHQNRVVQGDEVQGRRDEAERHLERLPSLVVAK